MLLHVFYHLRTWCLVMLSTFPQCWFSSPKSYYWFCFFIRTGIKRSYLVKRSFELSSSTDVLVFWFVTMPENIFLTLIRASTSFSIHVVWLKFNDSTSQAGLMKIRVTSQCAIAFLCNKSVICLDSDWKSDARQSINVKMMAALLHPNDT